MDLRHHPRAPRPAVRHSRGNGTCGSRSGRPGAAAADAFHRTAALHRRCGSSGRSSREHPRARRRIARDGGRRVPADVWRRVPPGHDRRPSHEPRGRRGQCRLHHARLHSLRRSSRADAERARRVRRGRVGVGAAGVQRRYDVCAGAHPAAAARRRVRPRRRSPPPSAPSHPRRRDRRSQRDHARRPQRPVGAGADVPADHRLRKRSGHGRLDCAVHASQRYRRRLPP